MLGESEGDDPCWVPSSERSIGRNGLTPDIAHTVNPALTKPRLSVLQCEAQSRPCDKAAELATDDFPGAVHNGGKVVGHYCIQVCDFFNTGIDKGRAAGVSIPLLNKYLTRIKK